MKYQKLPPPAPYVKWIRLQDSIFRYKDILRLKEGASDAGFGTTVYLKKGVELYFDGKKLQETWSEINRQRYKLIEDELERQSNADR